MKKIQKFVKDWDGKPVEDWSTVESPEFKKMFRALKATLKEICEEQNTELVKFSSSHYDGSGFIYKPATNKYVYISLGQDALRYRVNVTRKVNAGPILIRTAEDPKDFRGGNNNFCTLDELPEMILMLLK